ncbi:MAG: rhomboid family intramembrane serine protease [Candidatus Woesearchaeota archaeon]
MRIKSVFLISFGIVLVSLFIFFLIPGALEIFSFSGKTFLSGEFWRLITFSFVHITTLHLIENIVAIALVSFLAYEFGLAGRSFVVFFIAVSFVIALADAFMFPLLVIAGASLGIYGVLGVLSIKGSNFVPKVYLIPLLGASVFLKYLLTLFTGSGSYSDLPQTLFHFSGFVTGLFLFYIPRKFKKRKYVLK